MKKRKYEFIENIAISDVAFKAYGKTLEELFENAARATFEVMVPAQKVVTKKEWKITLETRKVDDLLYDFLSELIALKDEKEVVLGKFEVEISKDDLYKLRAEVCGDIIDLEKYELGVDVKAVTMHKFGVEKTKEGYQATVVLDV